MVNLNVFFRIKARYQSTLIEIQNLKKKIVKI